MASSSCSWTVVVVHFGDAGPTEETARQLALSSGADRVIVVANDGTPRPAALAEPSIDWMLPGANLGYAGAINFAARHDTNEIIVAVNNDVEIDHTMWGPLLQQFRSDEKVGVVAPVLSWASGETQSGMGRTRGLLSWQVADEDPGPRARSCDWVSGAVMLVRQDALAEVGWPSEYFLGFEDVELCRRMTGAGYSVICDGRFRVLHKSGSVIGPLWQYYYIRNRLWYCRRTEPRWRALLIAVHACFLAVRSYGRDVLTRRRRLKTFLFVHGVRDGLRSAKGVTLFPSIDEPRAAFLREQFDHKFQQHSDRT